MSNALDVLQASLFAQAAEFRMAPCDITATSPLTITVYGSSMLAVPQRTITYTTGPAVALIPKIGQPLVYQIGP